MQLAYYEYTPQDGRPDGVYDNPHFGELVPGRVIQVRPDEVSLVADHPDFQKSTKKAYEGQPSILDEHARLTQPTDA